MCIAFGGFVAIFLYHKNKLDEKKASATIVCQEILLIESRLKELKEIPLKTAENLYHKKEIMKLTSNSWERSKHLFVKKLTTEEYNSIQNFLIHHSK